MFEKGYELVFLRCSYFQGLSCKHYTNLSAKNTLAFFSGITDKKWFLILPPCANVLRTFFFVIEIQGKKISLGASPCQAFSAYSNVCG
jgi:hypothetical protein